MGLGRLFIIALVITVVVRDDAKRLAVELGFLALEKIAPKDEHISGEDRTTLHTLHFVKAGQNVDWVLTYISEAPHTLQ